MDFKNSRVFSSLRELSNKSWTYEYSAGFVAFMILFSNHVANISSRHMAVAFRIPEATTGIYFTKLFGFRGFLILFGSLGTYILKWFISEKNIVPTLIFSTLIMVARFCAMIIIFTSKNPAFHIYNFYVVEALFVGLFQISFYALTPEFASLLSLCVRISKITVFFIQLIMDFTIYHKPMLMLRIHFSVLFTLSFISMCLWYYYCFSKGRYANKENDSVEMVETRSMQYFNIVNAQGNEGEEGLEESTEPAFLTHVRNCISPILMSVATLIMNNMISPGLLPYALLERDKCHKINMAGIPMGVAGCLVIHILKKNIESMNTKWTWHWHAFWVCAIPPFVVFILTFVALHTTTAVGAAIYNSQNAVLIMAVMFFFFHPMVETLGFVGVVSNVRHLGKVLERGLKVISTNLFFTYIVGFTAYKVSVGYNVMRSSYELQPDPSLNILPRLFFWFTSSFKYGFRDFVNEFRLNIKEYI
ncbi:conserved hypothetical protein [Theileria orientalis strain Shintoku]|uniref:Uncharacterized protein n=1 Tax=Theileria orientalis strain Shintoku TaxID=869250 RepID=J4C4B3_THEOR|nr:conserved hypothetical protein [Theileria orientalis strain Shintoku]BAM41886.1 conserved hypothetical protein [Theileria orientalis strain Shintoku]|eukprot:XP_009692187.1 conserved hypothetical protein [Theileria orientalis strain Shintoku]